MPCPCPLRPYVAVAYCCWALTVIVANRLSLGRSKHCLVMARKLRTSAAECVANFAISRTCSASSRSPPLAPEVCSRRRFEPFSPPCVLPCPNTGPKEGCDEAAGSIAIAAEGKLILHLCDQRRRCVGDQNV